MNDRTLLHVISRNTSGSEVVTFSLQPNARPTLLIKVFLSIDIVLLTFRRNLFQLIQAPN